MIDTSAAIACAFDDWSEKALILLSNKKCDVIYDDCTKLLQLGLSRFKNTAGFLLIKKTDIELFKLKDRVKLIESDKIVIIESLVKEGTGIVKAELSYFNDDEVFNDFNFE